METGGTAVSERARVVTDAAVRVVGTRGLRALTHRAVDAEAGLPAGATSNVHRSRSAMVGAILERMLEQETSAWFAVAGEVGQAAATEDDARDRAADLLLGMLDRLSGDDRHATMARLALFGETAWDAEVRDRLLQARSQVRQWSREVLARVGLDVDEAQVVVVLGAFDHLLGSRLMGEPPGDLERRVVLAALRGARPVAT